MTRFIYNVAASQHGENTALLGPSYRAREDESVLIMESQQKMQEMDETDPILGERLSMGGRRGGKFKLVQDKNSDGDV